MTAANVRQAQRTRSLVAPAVGEVIDMFVRHNPQTPRKIAETAGRLTAALGAAAAKLSVQQQIELAANKEKFRDLFVAMLAELEPQPASIEEGTGLGEQLDAAEGRRHLQDYATPMKIEDWAGPVAGSSELERDYGIRRSTLHDWQKQHAVIGLLAGQRKHVFPVTQFIDGRPLEGLGGVVSRVGSPRAAWLWLVEPHRSLRGERPLDHLKAGENSIDPRAGRARLRPVVKFDGAVIDQLRVNLQPRAYLRITPLKHASTPLGMGYGETRFASPSKAFKVLYITRTLVTGVAETVIRDRFVARARRRLMIEEVEEWGVTEVRAIAPLSLLDLRTTGLVQLGVVTNAVRGKSHGPGRRFSEALCAQARSIDGLLYPSRLTNDLCIAVYDRAQPKLSAGPVAALTSQSALLPALKALNITVIAA